MQKNKIYSRKDDDMDTKTLKLIFYPTLYNNTHWVLIYVQIEIYTIALYDSLNMPNSFIYMDNLVKTEIQPYLSKHFPGKLFNIFLIDNFL